MDNIDSIIDRMMMESYIKWFSMIFNEEDLEFTFQFSYDWMKVFVDDRYVTDDNDELEFDMNGINDVWYYQLNVNIELLVIEKYMIHLFTSNDVRNLINTKYLILSLMRWINQRILMNEWYAMCVPKVINDNKLEE